MINPRLFLERGASFEVAGHLPESLHIPPKGAIVGTLVVADK